jgi:superfamily II DNA or RNA helicase
MTREELRDLALSKIDGTKCLILELATGTGKSKIAIDLANHICDRVYADTQSETSILLLVSKKVHKETWKEEFKKWGGLKTDNITIECYESLHKYKGFHFDVVIADEMHHLSLVRLSNLHSITIHEAFIGLSATISKDTKKYFETRYNAQIIECDINEAISNDILPEPTVYLIPLKLDNESLNYKIKRYNRESITTQRGYYNIQSSLIDWYKDKYFRSRTQRIKNLWLSEAGKRLKWLSEQKESIVLDLLNKFKNYRTLTFCNNIEQAERLGKYNITSKNKEAENNYKLFNDKKIKHITAVNILNENANLVDCRIGIFCNLNSSEIITVQRLGRLLRHKNPAIIIPYYVDTREEELMKKMIEGYNPDTIKVINNINEFSL